MASHQHLSKPDSSPRLVTSFPPQHIQASPQTEPTSESPERDLKAERERTEQFGHNFSRVQVLSEPPPANPSLSQTLQRHILQRQIAAQINPDDPQAQQEQQSSLSEQEKMTLISVLQEIREVSLPAADFVSGAVYQWLYNNGETGRWLLQATSAEWRERDRQAEAALPDSEAFELGRSLGDGASVITGLAEMGKGGGAIAGGGSCLAGGAAVAVGSALVVHGAGTTTAGVQGLAERLGIFFSKSNSEGDSEINSTEVSPRTPVGRSGQQTHFPNSNAPQPRNSPTTINGRDFSGHALDRMQERGFTPSVVESTIQNGTSTPGKSPETVVYTDTVNKLRVVVNSDTGRVVTVIGGDK